MPSWDVAKLLVALNNSIQGEGEDEQEWSLTSAVHGNALGLKINAFTPPSAAKLPELPLTSVKLPALHGWAGTRATGSDDRYEHTLVLYTDLEAPGVDGTADDRHMVFGWWLRKDKQDGALAFKEVAEGKHTVRGGPAANVSVTAEMTGTATYTGAAAGMYALKREGQTDEGGEWTAKATMTADFGDATESGTMMGTITEFMVGGQSHNWQVDLKQVAVPDEVAGAEPGDTDWTIDGVKGTVSSWWHGGFNSFKGTPGGANSQPTGMHGEFTAHYGTEGGHMVGAFGAHKN